MHLIISYYVTVDQKFEIVIDILSTFLFLTVTEITWLFVYEEQMKGICILSISKLSIQEKTHMKYAGCFYTLEEFEKLAVLWSN